MTTPYPIRYTQSAFDDYNKLIYEVNFQEFYKYKSGKKKSKDQFVITFTHYLYPDNKQDKIVYEILFDELANIDPVKYLEETRKLIEAIDNQNKTKL